MRIGIAAAGSGGHVYPALAVADALVERGVAKDEIVFFGGDRMEATTVPAAGYRFVRVDIRGFRRSLSVENLTLPLKVRAAARTTQAEIQSAGLDAMIVFGGYISGPAAQAARRERIPLIVHEQNAVPGMANKMIARRADAVLVAFSGAADVLPNATVVGNPLRSTFDTFDRERDAPVAKASYGISSDQPVLGIVGGSLGAAALNELAAKLASDPRRDFTLLHLCGPTHADAMSEASGGDPTWVVVPFEDDMTKVYASSDMVVSRAGAITIAELEQTGTPAIVVPLPAGKGYQARNADDLVATGGAIRHPQTEMDSVVADVFRLMGDPVARKEMATKAADMGNRRASAVVATTVLGLVDA